MDTDYAHTSIMPRTGHHNPDYRRSRNATSESLVECQTSTVLPDALAYLYYGYDTEYEI